MLDSLMTPELTAFLQIIVIDIVMSGDNAIIIGMAAAGLPPELRKKAIFWGIIGATVLRIFFAVIVVQLLSITGIKVIGGLLLLWVCWRMWKEIRAGATVEDIEREVEENAKKGPPKTLRTAMVNIIVADARCLSTMSSQWQERRAITWRCDIWPRSLHCIDGVDGQLSRLLRSIPGSAISASPLLLMSRSR